MLVPTLSEMAPPRPEELEPVAKSRSPLSPADVLPVESSILELDPSLLSAVRKVNSEVFPPRPETKCMPLFAEISTLPPSALLPLASLILPAIPSKASPVVSSKEPLSPNLLCPEVIETSPVEPDSTEADPIFKFPLLFPVPDKITMLPPVFCSELPAWTITFPPLPCSVDPTCSLISPLSVLLFPVLNVILPAMPLFELPELIIILPVSSEDGVDIITSPLLLIPLPLEICRAPPPCPPVPAVIARLPPNPEEPDPTWSNKFPARPFALVPVANVSEPLSPD